MPEVIQCPECQRTLRVPDHLLGKNVKCPQCGATFIGAAMSEKPARKEPRPTGPRAAAPEEHVEERPAKRPRHDLGEEADEPPRARRRREEEMVQDRPRGRRREDDELDEDYDEDEEEVTVRRQRRAKFSEVPDWQKVRRGIGMILAAIFTVIGTVVIFICGSMIFAMGAASQMASAGRTPGAAATAGAGFLALLGLYLLGLLTAQGLQIAGNAYCLAAPARCGAKGLATASLILLVGGLVLYLGGVITNVITGGLGAARGPLPGAGASGVGLVMGLMGGLAIIAQPVVFLFFLRALALAMREDGLARSVVYLMVLGAITLLFVIVMAVVMVVSVLGAVASAATGNGGAGTLAGIGMLAIVGYCLGLVLGLTYFIWYIVTLFQIRGAITHYIRGRE